MLITQRCFKDNEHYNDILGDTGDAFVNAIGWLFTDEARQTHLYTDYCLDGIMTTPDFMNAVVCFISAAQSRQPELTIRDSLNKMIASKNGFYNSAQPPQIGHNVDKARNEVVIYSSINKTIAQTMVWGAYIWWRVVNSLPKKEGKHLKEEKALYNVLKDFSREDYTYSTDEQFEKLHFLMTKTDCTMKKLKYNLSLHTDNPTDSDSLVHEESNEKEITKEYEFLSIQNKELAEKVEELQAKVDLYEAEITEEEKMYNAPRLMLLYDLFKKANVDFEKVAKQHGNGVKTARLMNIITGISGKSCKTFVSSPTLATSYHGQTVSEIRKLLSELNLKLDY